jgi:mRNA interferase MazF
MKRGEVWLIDLGLAAKARPAVILSIPFRDNEKAVVTYVARTLQRRGGRFEVAHEAPHFRPGGRGGSTSLARIAVDLVSRMHSVVATALCRRAFREGRQNASTERGGYSICAG